MVTDKLTKGILSGCYMLGIMKTHFLVVRMTLSSSSSTFKIVVNRNLLLT